ncbi:spermine oxidase-like isoform X2 [Brevipalpus obovatus]|uniref:spermine oxidase-like isoform X2 n=1 Tax=Brevipalpus obovatus TaxID=246614 RepID=UPI003D9E77F6
MKSDSIRVAIIGAGISGLGVAYELIQSGFTNFVIYEALDYAGGRIHTLPFGGHLELGAQWIHGQEKNILYEMASQRDLITPIESSEGVGHFCTQDGHPIDPRLVTQVIMYLDGIKIALSNGDFKNDTDFQNGCSVADVFCQSFDKWLESKKCSQKERLLLKGIFDWFMKFETIDNSCHNLEQLSVISYTTYEQCEGIPLNNIRNGYSSMIEFFTESLPDDSIKLNTPVKQLMYDLSDSKVTLSFGPGKAEEQFDHVIITSSLGFLKSNVDSFFHPPLPKRKSQVVKSLGFGTVNKIYMLFSRPFWNKIDLGFQLVWLDMDDSYPTWAYDISGIDTVHGQPNVLVAWIGGEGAEMIESETDETVLNVLERLLKTFLSHTVSEQVQKPIKMVRTSWCSNNFIKGSYSNRTKEYEESGMTLDDLISPITHTEDSEWPLILFAGEATSEKFFSTTHGALESGFREANRLLQFWSKRNIFKSSGQKSLIISDL